MLLARLSIWYSAVKRRSACTPTTSTPSAAACVYICASTVLCDRGENSVSSDVMVPRCQDVAGSGELGNCVVTVAASAAVTRSGCVVKSASTMLPSVVPT